MKAQPDLTQVEKDKLEIDPDFDFREIAKRPFEDISPNELAIRWQCSRSSVDRIADRAGLSRVLLGEGRNGMVRYLRSEVVAYEQSRTVGREARYV